MHTQNFFMIDIGFLFSNLNATIFNQKNEVLFLMILKFYLKTLVVI